MGVDGAKRQLPRKVAWAVAMSTAAFGVEAIWEGQTWLLDGFNRFICSFVLFETPFIPKGYVGIQ